jgi:hypothetical protein
MWLAKGVFVGAGIFMVFSVFYLYWHIYSRIPESVVGTVSVDMRSIQHLTTQSPLYWTAFCLTVATACVCMKLLQKT